MSTLRQDLNKNIFCTAINFIEELTKISEKTIELL